MGHLWTPFYLEKEIIMSICFAKPVKLNKKFSLSYVPLLSTKAPFRTSIPRADLRHTENSLDFQRSKSLWIKFIFGIEGGKDFLVTNMESASGDFFMFTL